MTDFIDCKNITDQTQFIIKICIALLTIFLTIFYTLLLTLMNIAEDAKAKIININSQLSKEQDKAYNNINKFVSISAEYFHLMAVFMIFQILKIFAVYLIGEAYLVYLNFLYLCYLAWYFTRAKEKKSISKTVIILLFALFYLLPSVIWFITFQYALNLDLLLSFGVLLSILSIWFCYYPVYYSPFSSLKKLKDI